AMSAKHVFRVVGVLFALCSGLGLGLALSVWAGAGRLEFDGQPQAHAAQMVPQATSTRILPDYAARLTWDSRWTCPDPVLDLTAYTVQDAPCFEHVDFSMHLVNNNGGSRDYSLGTTHGYA